MIYGTVKAAIKAYKKLAKCLKGWGLEMNPHDPCVWNKMVDGSQLTLIFHIDDILASHKKAHIVAECIKLLDGAYGKADALAATRGKRHEHLGMTLDFGVVEGACAISQCDFVKKMHRNLPKELKGPYRRAPAPPDLLKVNENAPLATKELGSRYHENSAKLLWLGQRGRPDSQLATGFHCTRVKNTAVEDLGKLRWPMGYSWYARRMPLIISIDKSGNVHVCVDGAHAAHQDGKGHSGLFATMGRGAMMSASKKLDLVTTSSTETEVVSNGERFPKCAWFRYFRMSQGDEVKEDALHQDNQSCTQLHKNYPFSVGRGSKHVNIRCFFVVDKMEKRDAKMACCPTEKMVADHSAKPTQGSLLVHQRNLILGADEKDFNAHKKWYESALKQYELWDEEEKDLGSI